VVGEGADKGPGVVGIAGGVIANPNSPGPRTLWDPPFPGRGSRFGVIGFGADPVGREGGRDAVGVLGFANKSVGVLGVSHEHAGVLGRSATIGVVGDASEGHIGVEGFGNSYGVYGHVDFHDPNPDGAGVFGAASFELADPTTYTGRAGVFVGPVEVT